MHKTQRQRSTEPGHTASELQLSPGCWVCEERGVKKRSWVQPALNARKSPRPHFSSTYLFRCTSFRLRVSSVPGTPPPGPKLEEIALQHCFILKEVSSVRRLRATPGASGGCCVEVRGQALLHSLKTNCSCWVPLSCPLSSFIPTCGYLGGCLEAVSYGGTSNTP